MSSLLKIIALNLDIQWKSPEENINIIETRLKSSNADLYLLPEMFTTGFCMEAREIADTQEQTLSWMKSFCQKKQAALCGSVSVAEGALFFNRCYFVTPEGVHWFYDKRHLFSYSGEDKIYTPGEKRVVVSYKGVRFLLQICYDLRFPVWSRNRGDYDVALYLANWPQPRINAWNDLLKARAIENQAYVFGVNRVGQDGNGLYYPESTCAYDAKGHSISTKTEDIVCAEVDLQELQRFRAKFPVLNDADDFAIVQKGLTGVF